MQFVILKDDYCIPKAIDEIGYVDLLDVKKLILDKIGKS